MHMSPAPAAYDLKNSGSCEYPNVNSVNRKAFPNKGSDDVPASADAAKKLVTFSIALLLTQRLDNDTRGQNI